MDTPWIVEGRIDPRWPINTRGNIGEVVPEVLTPLSYKLAVIPAEQGWRDAFRSMGILAPNDRQRKDPTIIGLYGGYGYRPGRTRSVGVPSCVTASRRWNHRSSSRRKATCRESSRWRRPPASMSVTPQWEPCCAAQAGVPGVARGRARVVLDPADPNGLEPGDVLVAPLTDPAWTPLFLPAAAVVVNVGALMSHAIIVSRELGIPCAVSVEGATDRIPDSAIVEVDGAAGTVTILAMSA